MTTGIIVTDKVGHYQFLPTPAMTDSDTNHCRMFEGITHNSCLITDRWTLDMFYSMYPPDPECEIFIGLTLKEARALRPFRELVIASNLITRDNIDDVDRLLVFQYDEVIPTEQLLGEGIFPFPNVKPRVIGLAPRYRILQYEKQCQQNFENQSHILETLAVANSVNSLHGALSRA